jgi:hypothetical protein
MVIREILRKTCVTRLFEVFDDSPKNFDFRLFLSGFFTSPDGTRYFALQKSLAVSQQKKRFILWGIGRFPDWTI